MDCKKAERHNWISYIHLRKSKRFPEFYGLSRYVDENILEILMTELKVDKNIFFTSIIYLMKESD